MTRMTNKYVAAYIDATNGKRPGWLKTKDEDFCDICSSFHFVEESSHLEKVPECDFNEARLRCSCKGFHHIGICSHVICINHRLGKCDIVEALKPLTTKAPPKRGGNRKGKLPALVREPVVDSSGSSPSESDSSEDELLTHRAKARKLLEHT